MGESWPAAGRPQATIWTVLLELEHRRRARCSIAELHDDGPAGVLVRFQRLPVELPVPAVLVLQAGSADCRLLDGIVDRTRTG